MIEPIASLHPYPGNPNQGDVGAIIDSIARNGWYGSILCQSSRRRILAGHHRVLALRSIGATVVPVTWYDVDDATAARIVVGDNQTARLGSWDDAALATFLGAVQRQSHLEGTGFDADDLAALLLRDSPLSLTTTECRRCPNHCP